MLPLVDTVRARALSPGGQKAIRYTVVSVIALVISQVVLGFAYGLLHWTARSSAILSASVGALPSYILNRRWAWGKTGRSHLLKEVLPFWCLALLGLAIGTWSADLAETVALGVADTRLMQTMIVMIGYLSAYALLWVGKFVVLNRVLFATRPEELEMNPALDGRTGLPT